MSKNIYVGTYMYVTKINEKRAHDFERNQGGFQEGNGKGEIIGL